jgi:hypothetical protein
MEHMGWGFVEFGGVIRIISGVWVEGTIRTYINVSHDS